MLKIYKNIQIQNSKAHTTGHSFEAKFIVITAPATVHFLVLHSTINHSSCKFFLQNQNNYAELELGNLDLPLYRKVA